jgi:hypothetical protein
MPKINIELEIVDAQEVAFTLNATVKKIDYVLENNPPRKAGEAERLDVRGQRLTLIATLIETLLYEQAKVKES